MGKMHSDLEKQIDYDKESEIDEIGNSGGLFGSVKKVIKTALTHIGPGWMIAVGYLDPGNWATDIEAGSKFGYQHLFIILISTTMALLLQYLCIRLANRTGLDLATACRIKTPKYLNYLLYILAEVSIIACDLSEVIGTAIALKLLLGLNLKIGIILTILDVFILLCFWNDKRSLFLERLIIFMTLMVGGCFFIQIAMIKPNTIDILRGCLPSLSFFEKLNDSGFLVATLGILGATVMPHNLYLHTFLALQQDSIKWCCIDALLALVFAMLINGSILIVASETSRQKIDEVGIEQIANALSNWQGTFAGFLFVIALLAAGQSSTLCGTMAGQIIFEGHLQFETRKWTRKLLTRSLSIVPSICIFWIFGDSYVGKLLIWSQIVLSFQLPFAMIPLLLFSTQDIKFYSPLYIVSWVVVSVVIILNMALICITFIN